MSDTQTQGGGAGFDLSQFHGVFFEEAGENLANMETLLLALVEGSTDDEALNAIFRCAHSIKGGAATFGFRDVADLTHVMETLLDKLRRHELTVTTGMIDTLLESLGDTVGWHWCRRLALVAGACWTVAINGTTVCSAVMALACVNRGIGDRQPGDDGRPAG